MVAGPVPDKSSGATRLTRASLGMARLRMVALARALTDSADGLLGVKPVRDTLAPETAPLLKRLQRIEELRPLGRADFLRRDAASPRGVTDQRCAVAVDVCDVAV